MEDDDDIGWQTLAQSIPLDDNNNIDGNTENNQNYYNNNGMMNGNNYNGNSRRIITNNNNNNMVLTKPSSMIHPLARICCWRGQAYAETGHPLRAATYWKRALTIDPLCVQALDYLLDRSVCSSEQALEVILHLNFPPSEDMDWLRALYLARVHVSTPKSSSSTNVGGSSGADTTGDDLMKSQKLSTTTTNDDPFWQEASSIQLSSPMPTNPELSADKMFTFGVGVGVGGEQSKNSNKESASSSTNALVESSLDTLWNCLVSNIIC